MNAPARDRLRADGLPDLAIAHRDVLLDSYLDATPETRLHIVWGDAQRRPPSVALNDTTLALELLPEQARAGSAGDFDGDGFDDLWASAIS